MICFLGSGRAAGLDEAVSQTVYCKWQHVFLGWPTMAHEGVMVAWQVPWGREKGR